MSVQKTVLLLTDFSYQAKGREYFREDVELSCYLRRFFKVCISHIDDIEKVIDHVDAIVIRNTGPQMSHCTQLTALRNRADLVRFRGYIHSGPYLRPSGEGGGSDEMEEKVGGFRVCEECMEPHGAIM